LSLREAAEQAGVSKSTVFRAIKGGRLSAPRTDDGGFAIDPAELFRVYPPKGEAEVAAGRAGTHSTGQGAPEFDTVALRVRNAELEAELKGLRAMADELRQSRDKWESQAERLVRQLPSPEERLPAVIQMPSPDAQHAVHRPAGITITVPSWWPFRRAG
jgi:excisionase family DNA binding protein